MKFVEAFNALGYEVEAPRQDWSAEKADGVCVTLWNQEISKEGGLPYMDLWEHWPEGGEWQSKPGNAKRIRHINRALNEFGGRVDVIFVSGNPGQSYENAEPWIVEKRQNRHWHITRFDREGGNFRAEIAPATKDEGQ